MSLLESVQAIVPEARSLAEAIHIRRQQYRGIVSRVKDVNDLDDRITILNESNRVAREYITLMQMERGYYKSSESFALLPIKQEATA